jgi:hypothetical protein
MQTFLSTCRTLGLDQLSLRAQKLQASIPALQSETVLFLICGHDFIHNPSDLKFRGIDELFVQRNSPFELNLYSPCVDEFNRTVKTPGINASIEGTSYADQPGKQVNYDPQVAKKAGGVKPGGVGNYNLQTKALEVIVTHPMGLDKDGALQFEILQKLNTAFAKPAGPLGEIAKGTLADMKDRLRPYWGGGTSVLGLA